MYVIFKNDCTFYLTDRKDFQDDPGFLMGDKLNMKALFESCENKSKKVFIYHTDLPFLWRSFNALFKVIEAAGGIVTHPERGILFIKRDGVWDLPKGKIEKGETRKEAAVREVEEECGISGIKCGDFIDTTYHIYEYNGQAVLKYAHWFEMFSDETEFEPQTAEGITEVKWFRPEELKAVLEQTYGNIRLLLENYLALKSRTHRGIR